MVISKTNNVFIISNWLQGSDTIITTRAGSCGKVMFSPVSVGILVPCPFWGERWVCLVSCPFRGLHLASGSFPGGGVSMSSGWVCPGWRGWYAYPPSPNVGPGIPTPSGRYIPLVLTSSGGHRREGYESYWNAFLYGIHLETLVYTAATAINIVLVFLPGHRKRNCSLI